MNFELGYSEKTVINVYTFIMTSSSIVVSRIKSQSSDPFPYKKRPVPKLLTVLWSVQRDVNRLGVGLTSIYILNQRPWQSELEVTFLIFISPLSFLWLWFQIHDYLTGPFLRFYVTFGSFNLMSLEFVTRSLAKCSTKQRRYDQEGPTYRRNLF